MPDKDGGIYCVSVSTYTNNEELLGIAIEAEEEARELVAYIAQKVMREYVRFSDIEIFGSLDGKGFAFIDVANDIAERWYFFGKTGIVFPTASFPILRSVLTYFYYAEEEAAPVWNKIVGNLILAQQSH